MSYALQSSTLGSNTAVGAIVQRRILSQLLSNRPLFMAQQRPEILLIADQAGVVAFAPDGTAVSIANVTKTFPEEWAAFKALIAKSNLPARMRGREQHS